MSAYTASVTVTISNDQVFLETNPFKTDSFMDFISWVNFAVEHFSAIIKNHYGWTSFELELSINKAPSSVLISRNSEGNVEVVEYS